MTEPAAHPRRDPGMGQWIGLAIGLPVIAYGIRGALVDADRTHPAELARWVVGAAVVHDLLFVPLVLATGWAMRRWAPAWLRPPLQWAVATSVVLALFAWPFIRGYGVNPTVPSLLARDYETGLLAYVGVVWAVATVWSLVRRSAGSLPPDAPEGMGHR